ncbi:tRNA wybutosine-synthesizing protein [Metarhizium rileyi]|uniref:tRNA(Phe) 7-[(3-amino-3-carboxypropyl)-4-demethylwyosine(37)-N(4)]-methyltransferase n=1 Tax=Metarhizium rileyi (strain RCEF 4871) TaxID=1649241 RepID=A0A162LYG9_METRR|nr:tRNA wybutosine-synthesizing protein [Metarhizium rileyi RCEF 4871]
MAKQSDIPWQYHNNLLQAASKKSAVRTRGKWARVLRARLQGKDQIRKARKESTPARHTAQMRPRLHLPSPSSGFTERKTRILQQLAVPEAEYTDLSPKGTVDRRIRHLIDEINSTDGFVTTSSCAGRVSIFLEGRKTPTAADVDDHAVSQVAGVGGKGAGGTWLYVSHDPVEGSRDWLQELGLEKRDCSAAGQRRLIHFKFEPMILHLLTASLAHAQLLLRSALQAGFRESGAINLISSDSQTTMPMVAIRSMGLGLESLIGYESAGRRYPLVSASYLQTLMDIGNERFAENTKRIERFRRAFEEALVLKAARLNAEGGEWEDPAARSERMRAEGLRRKALRADAVMAKSEERESKDDLYGGLH